VLAALSVGCAVGSRVALPPLPVVALFDLLAATLPAGSSGASYGPATVSTNLSTSGTGTVSACQFVSPAGTTAGTNVVPVGLQVAVGTPVGGAANTGCTISGVIGDTNGDGMIGAGEGVAPGNYTFTVRAADSSSPPQSDTQTYTIIVSSLQIMITAPAAGAMTVTGQSIAITWSFTVSGSPSTPNQQAIVELLGPSMLVEDSCTALLTALGCGPLVSTTAGAHTIRLTYPNPPAMDPNFPGTTTTSIPHTVNQAATTTTVVTAPNPSVTGQMFAANVTVATNPPGGGAPTGTVMVSDGLGNTCNAALTPGVNQSTGSCNLNGPTAGTPTITANYPGDANYLNSSGNVLHTINPAATTTLITSDAPDPSVTGEAYTVNWTVTVNAPGAGTPTGTVTVDDGTGAMCSAAVAAGSCVLTSVSAGNKTLTATYGGDANFLTSNDTEAHVVNQAATTTTITSDANDPSITGETYTVNLTVGTNAPGTGQPTGTVAVNDGQGQTCMAALAPGPGPNQSSGSCMITSLTTAVTTLTANYPGDANYIASSDTEPHTVTLAPTTTTITVDNPDPSVAGAPVVVTATVDVNAPGTGTPTGTVTVDDGQGQSCVINLAPGPGANQSSGSCLVSPQTTSVTQLSAMYSGDASFAASSDTEPHVVTLATTTTTLTSGLNPSIFGQSVTFTATVSVNPPGSGIPTGTVTFVDTTTAFTICASVPLVGVTAQCTTAGLNAGLHDIQAIYSGDANFSGGNSNLLTQTVNQSATTTALMSSLNPSVFNQAVSFTATVTPVAPGAGSPTGSVSFVDTTLGVGLTGCAAVPLNAVGMAVCTVFDLQAGNHDIRADYLGDANFQASTSTLVTQTVNPNTTTVLMSSNNPSVFQELVTFTATVTDLPGGTPVLLGDVTFVDNTTATTLCANLPMSIFGQAFCSTSNLSVATHNIQATYNGFPGVFSVSLSNIVAQGVNQATTTTTLNSSLNPSTVGDNVTFTAAIAVNAPGSGAPVAPGGTVTFVNTTTASNICVAVPVVAGTASCMTNLLGAGVNNIQANYTGDANFTGSASNVVAQNVLQAPSTTALVSSANPSVSGETVTFTATVSGAGPVPTGTVQFQINGVNAGAPVALVGGMASFMQAFTVAVSPENIDALYSGDTNYAASAAATLVQTINQASSTTTLVSSVNPSVSGENVTFTATVTANAPGAGAPTGTVQFLLNGLPFGAPVALVGGVAMSATTTFTVANSPENIDATYSGDTEFLGSNSNTVSQVTNQANVVVIVTPPAGATVTGETYQVDVTVGAQAPGGGTPSGSVTVSDGLDTCVIAALAGGMGNCMLTSTTAGAKTLTANYAGDTEFAAGAGNAAHTVNPASTIVTVSDKQVGGATQNTTFTGQDYEVLITVVTQAPGTGEPTGMVMIQDDNVSPTDSCLATLTPGAPGTNTSTGFCTILNSRSQNNATDNIEADYQGDGNFAISTSALFAHVVNKGGTGLNGGANIVKSTDPTVVGETYTVTVSVNASVGEGNPTGTVDVDDGQGSMCTTGALVPGPGLNQSTASCMLTSFTTASTQLNATYAGDADFNGVSASNAHTVNAANTTTTITMDTPDPSGPAANYTVTVVVDTLAPGTGSPTGTVTVSDNDTAPVTCPAILAPGPGANQSTGVCMLASNPAATPAVLNLTADYPGDGNYNASSDAAEPHTVDVVSIAAIALGDGVENRIIGNGTAGLAGVRFPITGGTAPYVCTDPGGTLPAGVNVVTAVTGTDCELQGTPAGGSAGNYMVDITVTDQNGAGMSDNTGPISWDIQLPLAITSGGAPGDAVDQRNYGAGGTAGQTASGGIPLLMWDDNAGTLAADVDCASFSVAANGDITATPATDPGTGDGVCNFTSRVRDAGSTTTAIGSDTIAITISIQPALMIATTTLPNAKRANTYLPIALGGAAGTGGPVVSATGGTGTPFTYTVTAGNFTNVAGVWTGNAGTTCEGLSFNETAFDAGSGNAVDTVVNGAPVLAGVCSFTITVSDVGSGPTPGGTSSGQALTITILGTFGYVTASANNTLQVFNTSTNTFTTSIALAASPDQAAITRDGRFVVVTLPSSDQVEVIDVTTNARVAGSPFSVGPTCDEPRGVATNDLPGIKPRAYIVCRSNDVMIGIDLDPADLGTGAFAAINDSYLDISNGSPIRLAVTPNGQRFYATINLGGAGSDSEFAVIDVVDAGAGTPGPILNSPFAFDVAGGDRCRDVRGVAIAVTNRVGNPIEAYFACSNGTDDNVLVFNTANNTLTVNNTADAPDSIAFIPGTPAIRAHITEGDDDLEAVDTDDGITDNAIALAPGAAPLGVVVEESDPAPVTGFRVYVAFSGVVSGNSNKVGVFNDANPPTANAANPITLQAGTNLAPVAVVVVIIPRLVTP
jgi:hypothetical protein